MKILALTNLYPNPNQPHRATFNRLQFRALAAEHEVQVIAPIAWTGEWAARHNHAGAAPRAIRRRIFDGMIVHHPRYTFTPKILRGWYGRFFAHSVRNCFHEAVASFDPDIVLGSWAYPDGWAAVRLAREAGLPAAIKVHGSDVLMVADHPSRRRGTVEALTRADAVIAVSKDLANQVVAMGAQPKRVHTVYNGIDVNVFHPGSRDEARQQLGIASPDPLIVFVGNLLPVKGLDVLMDALAAVVRTGPRFQCVLVGEGSLRRKLESQIEKLCLGDCVRLVGSQPQDKLPLWYRAAEMVVLPSRSEGIPNVLLEAAACGTRCVASHVGGIPEIVSTDALVPPGDATALAERVKTLLEAPMQPIAAPVYTPKAWRESARAMAAVLDGILAQAHVRTAVGG